MVAVHVAHHIKRPECDSGLRCIGISRTVIKPFVANIGIGVCGVSFMFLVVTCGVPVHDDLSHGLVISCCHALSYNNELLIVLYIHLNITALGSRTLRVLVEGNHICWFIRSDGDVNGSATANLLGGVEPNTFEGVFALEVAEQTLVGGARSVIEVTAGELATIAGYQATIELAGGVTLLDIEYGVAGAEHFGLTRAGQGIITTSWNGEAAAEAVLFSLVVESREDVKLSEVMSISSQYTAAEAYDNSGRTLRVGLDFGTGIATGATFALYQNQPNPFQGQTVIAYELPSAGEATLTIHDVTGKVLQLQRQTTDAGQQTFMVNSRDLGAAGVLYYTLTSGEYTATKKMVVVE